MGLQDVPFPEYAYRIGILGGSFDPPHHGHLSLAMSLMEARGLQEVWLCPAWASPFKEGRTVTSPGHRLHMAQLAIEGVPHFRVVDWECRQGKACYTIDTLRYLTEVEKTLHRPRQFFLLLGADSAFEFGRWHQPEEIVRLAQPLVGYRSGYPPRPPDSASASVVTALARGETPIPIMDISSTEIRHRLHAGLYCGHLLPPKVVDYIHNHHLYLTALSGLS